MSDRYMSGRVVTDELPCADFLLRPGTKDTGSLTATTAADVLKGRPASTLRPC